jgi:hypothetical protein
MVVISAFAVSNCGMDDADGWSTATLSQAMDGSIPDAGGGTDDNPDPGGGDPDGGTHPCDTPPTSLEMQVLQDMGFTIENYYASGSSGEYWISYDAVSRKTKTVRIAECAAAWVDGGPGPFTLNADDEYRKQRNERYECKEDGWVLEDEYESNAWRTEIQGPPLSYLETLYSNDDYNSEYKSIEWHEDLSEGERIDCSFLSDSSNYSDYNEEYDFTYTKVTSTLALGITKSKFMQGSCPLHESRSRSKTEYTSYNPGEYTEIDHESSSSTTIHSYDFTRPEGDRCVLDSRYSSSHHRRYTDPSAGIFRLVTDGGGFATPQIGVFLSSQRWRSQYDYFPSQYTLIRLHQDTWGEIGGSPSMSLVARASNSFTYDESRDQGNLGQPTGHTLYERTTNYAGLSPPVGFHPTWPASQNIDYDKSWSNGLSDSFSSNRSWSWSSLFEWWRVDDCSDLETNGARAAQVEAGLGGSPENVQSQCTFRD